MSFCIIPRDTWAINSTETKPTEGVQDGQTLIEKDTGNTFIFDLETKTWKAL